MKFEFDHDDYSTYTFRAYETEYDPVDPSHDREGVHIYTLDTDTMTLAIREAEYAERTVYLLDHDAQEFATHTQVFEHLFLMAFDQSSPPADRELYAVLRSQLDQAKLEVDTLVFPDGLKAHVAMTAIDGEAIVTYSRKGDVFHSADVTYAGAPTVQNVLATLFPAHFGIDEASRREQYRAELDSKRRSLSFELQQVEAQINAL